MATPPPETTVFPEYAIHPPASVAEPVVCRPGPATPENVLASWHHFHATAAVITACLDAGLPIVAAGGNPSIVYHAIKRALDFLGAAVLLVLLSPIWLPVLLILAVTTKGKPLFVQQRLGYRGRRFRMVKFRTMRPDAEKFRDTVENEHHDGPIFKNRRDPRITKIGRWLRRTSIDEMPQLWNVLIGDMSLVGPRPALESEVRQYKGWQLQRLSVKPGLTCLWQVSGRSDIGFEDWVRMDIWYARNQSLATDVRLLVRTPLSVLSCKGAY